MIKRTLKRLIWILPAAMLIAIFACHMRERRIEQPVTQDFTPPKELKSLQNTFRLIAEKVQPAVVSVTTYHEQTYAVPQFYFRDPHDFFYEFFYGQPHRGLPRTFKRRYSGSGSGVIISREGQVLTNAHVVEGAQEIQVIVTEASGRKRKYKARILGADERLDLALLAIEGGGSFPFAALGDSDSVQVGDWAIAIGSPFELSQTFTVGVISALRQSLSIEGRTYENLFQTDAAINRGNSGGPLLNIAGEVIGINTAIFSPSGVFSGIGFAIPINLAKETLRELQAGRQKEWGWLGVTVSDMAEEVVVEAVFEGGPADQAGLRSGDKILNLNGVAVKTAAELTEKIRRMGIGETVRLSIQRGGNKMELMVTLGSRPLWADIEEERRRAQPRLAPRSKADESKNTPAETFTWQGITVASSDDPEGAVKVLHVSQDSDLADYLEPGDIVLSLNSQPVSSLRQFRKLASKADFTAGVVFEVLRNGSHRYISVQR